MAQIFISYKREDRSRAKVLATVLIAKGYDVWWDVELLPGQDFYDEINKVIKNAKATIVLWSELAIDSRPVRSEAALADSVGTLIPARIDPVIPPLPFNAQHTIELSGWDGDDDDSEFQNLMKAIAVKAGPPTRLEKPESVVEDEIETAEDTWKILWASVRDLQPESIAEYKHFIRKCANQADKEIIALAERRIAHLSRKKPVDSVKWIVGAVISSLALIATILQIQSAVNSPKPSEILEVVDATAPVVEAPGDLTIDHSLEDEAFNNAKKDGRVSAFGKYVQTYPNGLHAKSADQGAWASASRQDSIEAYEAYQKYFPNGASDTQARQKIAALQNRAKRELPKQGNTTALTADLIIDSTIVPAAEPKPIIGAQKYSSIVIDANSNETLHARAVDEKRFPASLVKLMTLKLAFDALEAGTLTLEEQLWVSPTAAGIAPSKLGLKTGETITVEKVIEAVAVRNANDMSVVLAERLGGTEEGFVTMMNAKAADLRMLNTSFKNPHGLPHPEQYTSAKDMATLALSILNNYPNYYHYYGQTNFTYNGSTRKNSNSLLSEERGIDGFITGYTRASGYNALISARRGNVRIIVVVFGGVSANSRGDHIQSLVDRGFEITGVRATYFKADD